MASRRNGEVDALRCFAMLAVVATHAGILPFGWIGVWIFYVISGFVVTASLVRHSDTTPGAWLSNFYARRAARIIPIYALYVLMVAVVASVTTGVPPWKALFSLLLFYNNFAMISGYGDIAQLPVGHLWTISVEMQFYLVYGPLFIFLTARTLVKVLVALAILSPLARALAGYLAPGIFGNELDSAYAIYATSFLHFDAFGAGALLALAWPALAASRKAPAVLFMTGAVLLASYVLAYMGVNALVLGRQGIEIIRNIVSGILYGQGREIWLYTALTAFNVGVVGWTATGKAPWRAITRVRWFQWVGEISYGAYVFHALTIRLAQTLVEWFVGQDVPFAWRFVVFILASTLAIAAAAASARYIERPAIRRMNRWLGHRNSHKVAVA